MTMTAVDERLLLVDEDMLIFSAVHAACAAAPTFNEVLTKADQIAAISAATGTLTAELLAARKEIAGLREGLENLVDHAEYMEVLVDNGVGRCRSRDKITDDGDMPWFRRSSPSAVEAAEVVAWPPLVDLARTLGFFASAIKSGEPWTETCQKEYEAANKALQAVYADLIAPHPPSAPQGVEVKPLEWQELASPREDGPQEPTGDIEAVTMIGEYSVCVDDDAVADGGPDWRWCVWSPVENLGHFGDLAEAQAAAQAHYRARILSAIQTSPEAGR